MKSMKLAHIITVILIFYVIIIFSPLLDRTSYGNILKSIIVGLIAGIAVYAVGKIKAIEGKKIPLWLGITIIIGIPVATVTIASNL